MAYLISSDMKVSINGGIQKWLVYKRKNPSKWMIWGYPYLRKPPNESFQIMDDHDDSYTNGDLVGISHDLTKPPIFKNKLVGVIPTPLKNLKVSWDDDIPN